MTQTFYVFLWPHPGMEQELVAYEEVGHESKSDLVFEICQSHRATRPRVTENGGLRRFGHHEVL
ncbi:hypothetical protein C6A87_015395 [Mycobacterium sp. ITM-2016-00317]|uniref:hypothetical protein n=1 Tax=Mycobacterium sp. ITM-2016-00317 TaxID=2099694 RepID=UPI00287FA121|nr:hypothetical protein [Mycobacterium sp. ITM-2016-00317]WNG85350.1 hypothetical protein C6A87_015395 [Mycobacterium sp. ITM-2016-00317]